MKKVCDVLILGAGIAGLSLADALSRRGLRSIIVSKNILGAASPCAAGILDPFLEIPSPKHPLCQLNLNAASYFNSFIQKLQKESGHTSGFEKTGMIYFASTEAEYKNLEKRYSWQRELQFPVSMLGAAPISEYEPQVSSKMTGGIFYPTVGRVIAPQFLKCLSARIIRSRSNRIVFFRRLRISQSPEKVWRCETGSETICARYLVNTKGAWASQGVPALSPDVIKPIRGQILILKVQGKVSQRILHTLSGHYVVPWPNRRYLVGSTVEDVGFRPMLTNAGRAHILHAVRELLPAIGAFSIENEWAGLRPCSKDKMPVIGPDQFDNSFVFTGLYRSGILLGPYLGKLLAKTIAEGRMSDELGPFLPGRFQK